MSSRADDFDVRYRGQRAAAARGSAASGSQWSYGGGDGAGGGTIDYDLGYDANGWDTQGFRSPAAGYADERSTARVGSPSRPADGPAASSSALASAAPAGTAEPLSRAPGLARGADGWRPGEPVPDGPRRGRRRGRSSGGEPPRRGMPPVKMKGSWWRHWTFRKALGLLLAIIGGFIVAGALAVVVAYENTPVPTQAMAAASYAQTVVYSSDGTLIGRFGTTNRQQLSYNQIPKGMIDAVVSAEDRNFWNEGGISPTGITRAAYEDVRGSDGSLQGGSTITQQFVRNYYSGIGTQQTLGRKFKEIFVAMKISKEKSKQWVLQNYLNTIFLGEGSYGVQAAAETYFGKPVGQLTVAQDAVIAALIQQPSTYPLPQYRAQLEARWHYVLGGMVAQGDLSAQDAAAMKFPALGDNVPQSFGQDVWDPYVMVMIYSELNQVYHLSQQQIYNGGYVIKTSLDDTKMAALYKSVSDNEAQINDSSVPFATYMHAGAALENPANGEIQALYPGPGQVGAKYNGTGKVITKKMCTQIGCYNNLATSREQVGSSFKPYILATAVKQGMNVKTSTLNGYNDLYIPSDQDPGAYSGTDQVRGSHSVSNDSTSENGPYTPTVAMAASINTAYADLWHKVAGRGSTTKANNIGQMAEAFGVDTSLAGITGGSDFQDQYAVALGEASLSVIEQSSMLATIADNGVYHDAHLITSITRNNVPTPIKITSRLVFNPDPTQNAEMDSQVQSAMSEDTASYGTAPGAALSNGQPMIAKTGTTEQAQSAFFVGAIPSQALTVALFTGKQDSCDPDVTAHCQTLNGLGGQDQGGYGGTWPASIWHDYAEAQFVPLGIQQFQPAVFTGSAWNQVPPGLRQVDQPAKKKAKSSPSQKQDSGSPSQNPGGGNPNPFPTYSCDPTIVTCNPNEPATSGQGQSTGATRISTPQAGATRAGAVAGTLALLPVAALRRRRVRRRRPGTVR